MNLHIIDAGPLVTVQDLGRFGWQRFGVPTSGAMDGLALRAANTLVCNPSGLACLEIGLGGLVAMREAPCVIAVTGRGVGLRVNGQSLPLWGAAFVRAGWRIDIQRQEWGWAYLAVAGGIDVPLVLGSRSTYLRGKFGGLAGRSLTSGDLVPIGAVPLRAETAWRDMPAPTYTDYTDTLTADVILGPQRERFTDEGIAQFLSGAFAITPSSDRMGYRLEGAPIAHQSGADIISDGIALGTLQVPASGGPILMMSDHATTGGYTKIATMTTLDVWRVAQCAPGKGTVRFRAVSVEDAQLHYRRTLGSLGAQVIDRWQEVVPW